MERSQLVSVIETARQRNITRAAEKLYISQSSLSNQIIRLEEELGVSLFERQRRRVFPTDAGEVFVELAEQILRQMDELKTVMEDHAKLRRGRLRVGILPLMLPLRVPELMREFLSRHPALELTLLEAGSRDLSRGVENRELDAALVIGSGNARDDGIKRVPLIGSHIMAVMSSADPLAAENAIAPEMLNGRELIVTTVQFNFQKLVLSELDRRQIRYRIAADCSQIETCFALAESGFGITFASRETADYYINDRLTVLPLAGIPARIVSLIYQKELKYHPALRAFVDFMREKF